METISGILNGRWPYFMGSISGHVFRTFEQGYFKSPFMKDRYKIIRALKIHCQSG